MDRVGSCHFSALGSGGTGRVNRLWSCLMLVALLGIALSPKARANEEADGPPAPVNVELKTRDGVQLNAVYYEGTEGEATVPVIVIHDWKEKGADYETLAKYLQDNGYAVIVPDLRGHGSSTLQMSKDGNISRKLTPRNVNPQNIIRGDLEAVRKFLLQENNEKKLNLAATCLVGVGKGAILATYYAVYDWDPRFRSANRGEQTLLKKTRGGDKDVKAMVLVSPAKKLDSLDISMLWKHPIVSTSHISTFILFGQPQQTEDKKKPSQTKEAKIAEDIHSRIKQNHIPAGEDVGRWTLFFKPLDADVNGQTLINETDFGLDARADIRSFMNLRLRDRLRDSNLAWKGKEDRPHIDGRPGR